jgi:hypothetical protein
MSLASFSSTPFSLDPLVIPTGVYPPLVRKKTLLSGQNCVRGTVLGAVTIGAVSAVADAGNTGTGALTGQAVGSVGVPQVGAYRAVCIEPAANAGTFVVYDPFGVEIGKHTVAGAAFNNQITFAIADSADFIAGDAFTITVAAGSGKYLKAVAAAVDGSAVAAGILSEDCDATSADQEAMVYDDGGDFNQTQLVFGDGHTADSVRAALRLKGIRLITATSA